MRGTNVSARTEACGGPAKPIAKTQSSARFHRASSTRKRKDFQTSYLRFCTLGSHPLLQRRSRDCAQRTSPECLRSRDLKVKILLRLKTLDRRFGLGFF